MWLARVTAFAANCNLLLKYLSFFWPAADNGTWRVSIITAVVVLLTIVNIVGIIDIEKLSKLEGQFGIPDLGIEPDDSKKPDTNKPQPPAAKKP